MKIFHEVTKLGLHRCIIAEIDMKTQLVESVIVITEAKTWAKALSSAKKLAKKAA